MSKTPADVTQTIRTSVIRRLNALDEVAQEILSVEHAEKIIRSVSDSELSLEDKQAVLKLWFLRACNKQGSILDLSQGHDSINKQFEAIETEMRGYTSVSQFSGRELMGPVYVEVKGACKNFAKEATVSQESKAAPRVPPPPHTIYTGNDIQKLRQDLAQKIDSPVLDGKKKGVKFLSKEHVNEVVAAVKASGLTAQEKRAVLQGWFLNAVYHESKSIKRIYPKSNVLNSEMVLQGNLKNCFNGKQSVEDTYLWTQEFLAGKETGVKGEEAVRAQRRKGPERKYYTDVIAPLCDQLNQAMTEVMIDALSQTETKMEADTARTLLADAMNHLTEWASQPMLDESGVGFLGKKTATGVKQCRELGQGKDGKRINFHDLSDKELLEKVGKASEISVEVQSRARLRTGPTKQFNAALDTLTREMQHAESLLRGAQRKAQPK